MATRIYVNNAQFSASDTDMRIDLCEVQDTQTEKDGSKTVIVTPKVRVFMSWPFAARFLNVMKRTFDGHQSQMRDAFAEMQKSNEISEPRE